MLQLEVGAVEGLFKGGGFSGTRQIEVKRRVPWAKMGQLSLALAKAWLPGWGGWHISVSQSYPPPPPGINISTSKHQGENSLSFLSSHHGAAEMNPTRIHEVEGLIPGLARWVKDPIMLQTAA